MSHMNTPNIQDYLFATEYNEWVELRDSLQGFIGSGDFDPGLDGAGLARYDELLTLACNRYSAGEKVR